MKRTLREMVSFKELETKLYKNPAFVTASRKMEHEYVLAKTLGKFKVGPPQFW